MISRTIEGSPKICARMAGVCYLLGAWTSVFGQIIIPGRLVVSGSAETTAANILAHESLYRFAIVLAFTSVPFHIVWALLFYRLFKPVNKNLPLLAALVLLMACAMWPVSGLFFFAPLIVLKSASSLSEFAPEQLQAVALMLLKLDGQAYDIGLVFFGLWCILIGYLIAKSIFLPWTIGALYALAGLGYLTLLWQPLSHRLYPYNLALGGPGEISLLFWLLVKGVNVQRWNEQTSLGI